MSSVKLTSDALAKCREAIDSTAIETFEAGDFSFERDRPTDRQTEPLIEVLWRT